MKNLLTKMLSLALVFTLAIPVTLDAQQNIIVEHNYLVVDYYYLQEPLFYEYQSMLFEYMTESDVRLVELINLVAAMIAERESVNAAGFSFEEDLPYYAAFVYDERFTLLRVINELLHEASDIQGRTRGYQQERIIISFFSEPNQCVDVFTIAFTSEEYLGLLDFILDYTDISRDEIEVSVIPAFVVHLPTPIYECLDELGIFETSPLSSVFHMGQPLMYRPPGDTRFSRLGTLGHPRNASGRVAFGTNHGVAPRNSTIYYDTRASARVGIVDSAMFNPSTGMDVSFINIEPGRSVSRGSITNFSATTLPLAGHPGIRVYTSRGTVNGTLRTPRTDVAILFDGNRLIFRNLITANVTTMGGDSGAALINNVGMVYGTLISGDGAISAFSPVRFYSPNP